MNGWGEGERETKRKKKRNQEPGFLQQIHCTSIQPIVQGTTRILPLSCHMVIPQTSSAKTPYSSKLYYFIIEVETLSFVLLCKTDKITHSRVTQKPNIRCGEKKKLWYTLCHPLPYTQGEARTNLNNKRCSTHSLLSHGSLRFLRERSPYMSANMMSLGGRLAILTTLHWTPANSGASRRSFRPICRFALFTFNLHTAPTTIGRWSSWPGTNKHRQPKHRQPTWNVSLGCWKLRESAGSGKQAHQLAEVERSRSRSSGMICRHFSATKQQQNLRPWCSNFVTPCTTASSTLLSGLGLIGVCWLCGVLQLRLCSQCTHNAKVRRLDRGWVTKRARHWWRRREEKERSQRATPAKNQKWICLCVLGLIDLFVLFPPFFYPSPIPFPSLLCLGSCVCFFSRFSFVKSQCFTECLTL